MFKKINLFSKTEMKILGFVTSKDAEMYEREIAKGAKVSTASANIVLNRFAKSGLVIKTIRGRMSFYKRNDANPRVRQYKVSRTVDGLADIIEKIRPISKRIVLFGSCAKGTDTEESDIDLFVLSGNGSVVRAALKEYPKISAIVLNSSEYITLGQKDKPLFERINQGIELYEREESMKK